MINIESFDFYLKSCKISMILLPLSQRNLRLVLFQLKYGGGGNSKKVNTHPNIPEIDFDFF